MKIIEFLFALKIFAAPLIFGLVTGLILKLNVQGQTGTILMVASILISLVIGSILLRRIKKKQSFSDFDSRINASPDLDNLNKKTASK